MSEPVDLDGIEARAKDADEAITTGDMLLVQRGAAARLAREDVPALVAEVRALRAKVEEVNDYADTMVRGKSLWMALDLRTITAGMRVVFTPDADTDGELQS